MARNDEATARLARLAALANIDGSGQLKARALMSTTENGGHQRQVAGCHARAGRWLHGQLAAQHAVARVGGIAVHRFDRDIDDREGGRVDTGR